MKGETSGGKLSAPSKCVKGIGHPVLPPPPKPIIHLGTEKQKREQNAEGKNRTGQGGEREGKEGARRSRASAGWRGHWLSNASRSLGRLALGLVSSVMQIPGLRACGGVCGGGWGYREREKKR